MKENKQENAEKLNQEEKEKKAKIKKEEKEKKAKLKKEKKAARKEKSEKNGTGRWVRKTSLTVLLILIIVVVCIGINLIVENANLTDIDVTSDKVYSLSDTSKDIIGAVDKDVYIMVINMSESIQEFIENYNSINDRIEIEIIDDLESRTDLTNEYGITADTSAVIVQCDETDKEKILSSSDFVTYDYTTYETIDTTEEAVTNAIVSVTTEEEPKVYALTGHNKYSSDYTYFFTQDLESESYEVDELDLLTTGGVPDDCSVLMITTLSEDITEEESEYILDYINQGGKIILFSDPNASGTDMPNFQAVLDQFGVSISEGEMLEQDTDKMLYQTPNAIIVTVNEQTSVTKDTDMNMNACFITSGRLEIADDDELEELGVTSETLATTSENSFYRTDYSIESDSMTDDDEEDGEAVVGALLQKTIDDDTTSELIVYANNIFITNMTITSSSGYSYVLDYYNNEDLAMNSIAYLSDRDNMITIRKDVEVTTYTATSQQNTIILIIIFAIPIIILIIGIVVWVYRRRKK